MIFHQPVSCALDLVGKFEFRRHLSRLSHRFILHLERAGQEALRICVEEKSVIQGKTLITIKKDMKANSHA